MSGVAPPWDRQAGEGKSAYAAFTIYRDLPPQNRSLPAVAERLEPPVADKRGLRRLERLARRWQWELRAAAWDSDVERRRLEAERQSRREMAERHVRQAVGFQQKLVARLQELDPAELKPADLVRWLDVAFRIERASRATIAEIALEHRQTERDDQRTLTAAILNDPMASQYACRLLERIAGQTGHPPEHRRKEAEKLPVTNQEQEEPPQD